MPNPYRDEIGRYASKEEMGAAVNTLEQAVMQAKSDEERHEAMGQWFTLKKRYDDLVEGRVSMPAEWVNRVATSGMTAIPHEADGQRVFYEQIRERLQNPEEPNNSSAAQKAISLLREKELPQDIREAIVRDSVPGVQANILRELNKTDSTATGADLLRALPETGQPLHPEVAEQLMASQKLTFEQKFEIAEAHGFTTMLVLCQPKLAANSPETESRILENMVAEGRLHRIEGASRYTSGNTYDRAWEALAEVAKNDATHKAIIERFADERMSATTLHPYRSLLANRHLSEARATEIMQLVALRDPASFVDAAKAYRDGERDHRTRLSNALYDGLFAYSGYEVKDSAFVPLTDDRKETMRRSVVGAFTPETAAIYQAQLDMDPATRKQLTREYKRTFGRNKASADSQDAHLLLQRINLAEAAFNAKKTMDYLAAGGGRS
jgi:hypothetical protein